MVTVGDLLARWVAVQEERVRAGELAEGTVASYRTVARHWSDVLGEVTLPRLTRALVEDTIRGWRAGGVSARTARLAHRVISMVCAWGYRRELCPELDLRRLEAASVDEDEHVNCSYTPTRAEVERVIGAIGQPAYRSLVQLMAATGCRVGEAAALRVGSWDRTRAELVITGRDEVRARRGKVKPRRFPILGDLGPLLAELAGDRQAQEPLVQGVASSAGVSVNDQLELACARVGVERFTPHGIRRMVVMELLDVTDAGTVSDLTGHSVQILLTAYVRPTPGRLRDAVARAFAKPAPPLRLVGAPDAGTEDAD